MKDQISVAEHLERVRRVQTVSCPRCGAPRGRPCRSAQGNEVSQHHAARYQALYHKQRAR